MTQREVTRLTGLAALLLALSGPAWAQSVGSWSDASDRLLTTHPHAHTADEIDRMRIVVYQRMFGALDHCTPRSTELGADCMYQLGSGANPSLSEKERMAAVHDRLMEYIAAGVSPEKLEGKK